jgi:Rrf2 family protein
MHISARSDYAVRAMLAIAADAPQLVKASALLHSHRGTDGGYALTRPAVNITVGDILRATSGSLTSVRGQPAEFAAYQGAATGLRDVWLAIHTAIEDVVDQVNLADLVLPALSLKEASP